MVEWRGIECNESILIMLSVQKRGGYHAQFNIL
jgi:hypothetical protein